MDTLKINRAGLIKLIEQFDEPQKPAVPQFVADWYEENKDDFDYNLWNVIYKSSMGSNPDIVNWIENTEDATIILVNMHQFGYEVKKERRYLVKMKGAVSSYLNYDSVNEWWFLNEKHNGFTVRTHHTRKELKEAGFGEVFNSPLFEVDEVE